MFGLKISENEQYTLEASSKHSIRETTTTTTSLLCKNSIKGNVGTHCLKWRLLITEVCRAGVDGKNGKRKR